MASRKISKLVQEKLEKYPKISDVTKDLNRLENRKIKDSAVFWQLLAIARWYLAFSQTGYIHPDEFHQSLQVTAYDILDIDAAKPWEYTSTSPIRSVVFIGFVSIPFAFLRSVSPVFKFLLNKDILTPNVLLVSSRMFMTLLSFVCDYCVFQIAKLCYVRPWQCLELFAGSYVMLVYATRTFSNSVELILFTVLLWRVSLSIIDSTKIIREENVIDGLYDNVDNMRDKVKLARLKSKLPSHNFKDSFLISVLVVFGFFVRPTFVIFSFVPVAFWLQRGVVTQEVSFWYFNIRFLSLIPGAVLSFVFCVLADSFYYDSLTFSELVFWDVNAASFTVTPYNFILYNSDSSNVSSHGAHPYLLHILVNIPLLFNVLGLVGLWRVSKYITTLVFKRLTKKPKVYSLATMLLLSFVVPVLALSLIPHQEPRFLIPVLPPLILLNSDRLSLYSLDKFKFSRNFLFLMWQTCNILCVGFYGFLHQGGVTKAMIFIHDHVARQPPTTQYHVYFSHMYSPPTFLLMRKVPVIAETEDGRKYKVPRTINTFDLGSSLSVPEILKRIEQKSLSDETVTTILCIAGSISNSVIEFASENSVRRIQRISGHVSMEHFPDFRIDKAKLTPDCDRVCQFTKKFFDFSIDVLALGFNSTKIKINTVETANHDEL